MKLWKTERLKHLFQKVMEKSLRQKLTINLEIKHLGTSLKATQLSSVGTVLSMGILPRIVLIEPKDLIAFFAEKTLMIHLTALRRPASNVTK